MARDWKALSDFDGQGHMDIYSFLHGPVFGFVVSSIGGFLSSGGKDSYKNMSNWSIVQTALSSLYPRLYNNPNPNEKSK